MLETGEMLNIFFSIVPKPGKCQTFFLEDARNWGNVKGYSGDVLETREMLNIFGGKKKSA